MKRKLTQYLAIVLCGSLMLASCSKDDEKDKLTPHNSFIYQGKSYPTTHIMAEEDTYRRDSIMTTYDLYLASPEIEYDSAQKYFKGTGHGIHMEIACEKGKGIQSGVYSYQFIDNLEWSETPREKMSFTDLDMYMPWNNDLYSRGIYTLTDNEQNFIEIKKVGEQYQLIYKFQLTNNEWIEGHIQSEIKFYNID